MYRPGRSGGLLDQHTLGSSVDQSCGQTGEAGVLVALSEQPCCCRSHLLDNEAGSYLRPIDYFITQLEAQGPSRTCNESKEEEEEAPVGPV